MTIPEGRIWGIRWITAPVFAPALYARIGLKRDDLEFSLRCFALHFHVYLWPDRFGCGFGWYPRRNSWWLEHETQAKSLSFFYLAVDRGKQTVGTLLKLFDHRIIATGTCDR